MGSGASRGKKVAPASASEVRGTKGGGPGGRKVHCVPPGSHNEGPRADCSGEDAVRGEPTDARGASVRKASPRRTFIRAKTYGLCPFSGEDTEDERSSSPQLEEPRVPRKGPKDVNTRSNCAFPHRKRLGPAGFVQRHVSDLAVKAASVSSTQTFSAGGTFLEGVATRGKQQSSGSGHSASLPMPVILYDGSEEELMDTIERDFSCQSSRDK
ncbi:uncharacterized protein V3H82_022281 [Fundulus diaphanus]